jgi:hypothetical protein
VRRGVFVSAAGVGHSGPEPERSAEPAAAGEWSVSWGCRGRRRGRRSVGDGLPHAERANGPAEPGGRREPAAGPPKAEPARGGERANRPQPQRRRGAGASECRPAERCRSGRAKPGGASEGERRAKAGVAPPPEEPPRTTAAAKRRPIRGGGRQGVGGAARGGGGASGAGRPTRPSRRPVRKGATAGPADSLARRSRRGEAGPDAATGAQGHGTGVQRGRGGRVVGVQTRLGWGVLRPGVPPPHRLMRAWGGRRAAVEGK